MLKAFEVFGREGGIRKTAQHIGVDPAIVSRHLRGLEESLGTALIDRTGGSYRLTPDGATYHARVSGALREIADATATLRTRDKKNLILWCAPGLAYHWLGRKLAEFTRQNPEIEIEFRPSDRPPDFNTNEADADVRYLRTGDEGKIRHGLRALEIARPPVFPVASPGYLARLDGAVKAPAALLRQTLLHEDCDQEWRDWLQAHGVTIEGRLPGPRFWHAHVSLDAARDGQGIALGNHLLLGDDLQRGRLVSVFSGDDPAPVLTLGSYHVIGREDRWNQLSLVRLRQWLSAAIQAAAEDRSSTDLA